MSAGKGARAKAIEHERWRGREVGETFSYCAHAQGDKPQPTWGSSRSVAVRREQVAAAAVRTLRRHYPKGARCRSKGAGALTGGPGLVSIFSNK
jgi:hypothetical protein